MQSWRLVSRIVLFTIFITMSSLFFVYPSAEGEEAGRLSLLVDEAIRNNPAVQEAYKSWQAQTHKPNQVSALPNPIVRYTYFGENVETKVGPQEHKYGISQKVPFPGKLYLKGKTEFKRAEILKEKYEAVKREVIKDVKFTYYDIFWVDRAIHITEQEKEILENLEKVAQRKYESNVVPIQDVIKAQVELSKILDRLLLLKKHRKSLEAKMNALLDRPKASPFDKVKEVKLDEFNYELEALHRFAGESRQELLMANLDIERAKYERSLAALDYLPDFSFGFDYIQVGDDTTRLDNDGQDAWTTTFALHVPIWLDKQVAQVREKQALLDAKKEAYENVRNSIAYEVEDVYYKITTYKDIVDLYKTALVPQTEEAFNAARVAYEAGKVDFLNWLDAERVLLQTRLAYYKAIVDYEKSIAYLERVVGRDL